MSFILTIFILLQLIKLPVAQQLILLSLLGTDVGVRGQRKIMNGLLYYEGRGKLLGIIESRVTCGHA